MARASTAKRVTDRKVRRKANSEGAPTQPRSQCEECWPLVGERRGQLWCSRPLRGTIGTRTRVEFDGPAILAREEKRGDIVGFLHTHPDCSAEPSQRDIATMRAWVSAFGKPLLCLIEGTDGLAGYCFATDDSTGQRVAQVERFGRQTIVALLENE